MITQEELQAMNFHATEPSHEKVSYQVTTEEMKRFNKSKNLPLLIAKRKLLFEKEMNLKPTPAYDALDEKCQISITTIKKTINGTNKVTRQFLYKFAVGLHMTLDEANEFFTLCGGSLRADNLGDYICIRALEDHDDIHLFIKQYEDFTGLKIAR